MRWIITICIGVSLLLTGCRIGMTPDEFIPAQRPGGIHTSVRLPDERLEGELLSINDTSLVIMTEHEVVAVPYRAMRGIRFKQRGRMDFVYGRWPPSEIREELRLLSRFPQGLSHEMLQQLLLFRRQEHLRTAD